MSKLGVYEGEICNRNNCIGIIDSHPPENCSCHINPPCSACTAPRNFCPVCGWEERDDDMVIQDYNTMHIDVDTGHTRVDYFKRALDPTKIDYVIKGHTHFSQICEGVYPEGITAEEVRKVVNGTFGGRFQHFGGGKFKFIAYTD